MINLESACPSYSSIHRQELWRRWRQGESIVKIARAIGKKSPSVRYFLSIHGGITPAPRRRANVALTLSERETISRGLSAKQSMRSLAKQLQRSPSTISREVNRNGGSEHYRAVKADQTAWQLARRPKPCKLKTGNQLCDTVTDKLSLDWSPQQISGWLKRTYPKRPQMQVSHETIYRSLYIQARGALKKELTQHLRRSRLFRRAKVAKEEKRGKIPNLISIRERPPEVEDRALPGHWEGDLIMGTNSSCIATLVERHSRYVMLAKVDDKSTNEVVGALIEQAKKLPKELYISLTWDRGSELKSHQRFTLATDVAVYFCDPSSPWQRGSNENTNGLLRQYFPKKTNLAIHTQNELDRVARQLNERPRETLGYETPAERFEACVASIR